MNFYSIYNDCEISVSTSQSGASICPIWRLLHHLKIIAYIFVIMIIFFIACVKTTKARIQCLQHITLVDSKWGVGYWKHVLGVSYSKEHKCTKCNVLKNIFYSGACRRTAQKRVKSSHTSLLQIPTANPAMYATEWVP